MESSRHGRAIAGMAAILLTLAAPAPRAGEVPERAGGFDYYILALSWIPAFCVLAGKADDDPRCTEGGGHGWMLHGLWPQHADGSWPEFCETAQRNPSRRETAAQADLFGVGWAAWHQWNKHGRCSGLSADDYFALSRTAIERVHLPDLPAAQEQVDMPEPELAPALLKKAFLAANPDFEAGMLTVTCRQGVINELRLCLNRALEPRACDDETLRRRCRLDAARMPAPQ